MGTLFYLNRPARSDCELRLSDTWVVQTKEGVGAVVARCEAPLRRSAIVPRAFAVIQEALDLQSIEGEDDLTIRDLHSQFLVWWTEEDNCVLRAVSSSTGAFRIRLGVLGTSEPQVPEWRPSYRFFRLSQVTDDLFDAFRNMYLAFESEVSQRHARNYPKMREEEWLSEALKEMDSHGLGISALLDVGIDRFVTDIYTVRKGTFHAKVQKRPLIPQDLPNHRQVEEALAHLTAVYLRMVPAKRTGGATTAGFERMAEAITGIDDLAVEVTSEAGTADADATGKHALLNTRLATTWDTSEPFQRHVKGTSSTRALSSLPHLGGFLLRGGGRALATFDLEGVLTLHGVDRLEVLLRLRLMNQREPKTLSWGGVVL